MTQKQLQKKSKYAEYDIDGDGIVSDEELSSMKEIKDTETKARKNLAQLRMARYTLFYISGAGIVGTYMGTTAYLTKNGK